MGFIKDFKAFAMKGNVIDMAVGVIIGGAFGKIVTSLVNDIIMPPIGYLIGGTDFKELKWVLTRKIEEGKLIDDSVIMYGNFIQNVVDFLIIALSIFITIRIITKLSELRKKEEEVAPAPAPEPQPSNEEKLLTEIRDLLKEKK
jgi:large conductance mechanosensitive channel